MAHKRSSMVSLSSISSTPSSQQLANNTWNSALDVSKSEKVNSSPVSLSAQHSGKKSRIPVLRSSSCRVPKNLSFGAGVQRTFVRPKSKHWHQTSEPMDTGVDLEKLSSTVSGLPCLIEYSWNACLVINTKLPSLL